MGLLWTQRYRASTSTHKGFTLIELMIVIAIIGILTSIAIPQYTLFTNRSFVASEGLSAARPFQIAVSEYYLVNQRLPTGATDLPLASLTGETPHVESVSVASDGTAKLTISFASSSARVPNDIKGKSLVLQPVLNAVSQNASWSVDTTGSTIPSEYLPRL